MIATTPRAVPARLHESTKSLRPLAPSICSSIEVIRAACVLTSSLDQTNTQIGADCVVRAVTSQRALGLVGGFAGPKESSSREQVFPREGGLGATSTSPSRSLHCLEQSPNR
jgi:hypothetical protein